MPLNLPNLVTWLRIILIPLLIGIFYLPEAWLSPGGRNVAACVVFIIAGVSDWLDGYLARVLNQASAFGAFLDPVADKLIVVAALVVLLVALIGRVSGQFVPPAPPAPDAPPFHFDWHIIRASRTLVSNTLHIPRLFLAIIAISFFWAMGAILAAQFTPLVKNALGADQTVATLFLATFSVGVAIGSPVDGSMTLSSL